MEGVRRASGGGSAAEREGVLLPAGSYGAGEGFGDSLLLFSSWVGLSPALYFTALVVVVL